MPPMKCRNAGLSVPSGFGENIAPGFLVDDRLVDMHRGARLALHRLRHEGRIHVVLQRRFADGALEQEHLIGKLDRIAVTQIDFHLRRAFLMDQRVDLQALAFGEMIDVVDEFVELVDGGDGIALPPPIGRPERPTGGSGDSPDRGSA